jgi:hypothetical protein
MSGRLGIAADVERKADLAAAQGYEADYFVEEPDAELECGRNLVTYLSKYRLTIAIFLILNAYFLVLTWQGYA